MRFALTAASVFMASATLVAQSPHGVEVHIPHGESVMDGRMFLADRAGPHPTVVLLEGMPGSPHVERNVLGLAGPLIRAGFNALWFHYRGAWGSGGTYGLIRQVEDAKSALAFLNTPQVAEQFGIDTAHQIVVGHSLGGANALITAIEEPRITCTVAVAPANLGLDNEIMMRLRRSNDPDYELEGLGGYTPRDLRREIEAHQGRVDVAERFAALRGRPLLIVSGEHDALHTAISIDPFVKAARAGGATPFAHVSLDADHNFSREGNLEELSAVVVGWLTDHCM